MVRTLGIIGGIAPPSTIDYYRQLTSRYRERGGDGSHPSIIIDSIDATAFLVLIATADRPAIVDVLLRELDRLAAAGADVALFASNTPHLVFDEVAERSPVPLISIVEETAKVAVSQGYRRVGLIGTRFTMERGFYQAVFGRHGIEVVLPAEPDRALVHERYLGELVEGVFRDDTRAAVAAVIDRTADDQAVEAVVLGGTELPLLVRGVATSVPMLDTTAIHVESAVDRLLA